MKQVARTGFAVANDATDLNQVGTVMYDGATGKAYKYVQVEDMDLAAYDVVAYANATGTEVTQDRAGGSALSRDFAGVAVNTITDAYYGWVQIQGLATCRVLQNTAVAAGNRVMLHTTDDGGVIVATTTNARFSFGVALAADTATTSADGTVAVMID